MHSSRHRLGELALGFRRGGRKWLSRFGAIALGVGALGGTALAQTAATAGAWSTLAAWPLIPIHMVLTRAGDVVSYGTSASGQQTGYFIYDVWNWRAGLSGGHTTLPNGTLVDLFCNGQIQLPNSDAVVMFGGDIWNGAKTTGVDNRNTVIYRPGAPLARGPDMWRARWYATATMLDNGEILIQGGRRGADRPEVRQTSGQYRLLSGANTSSIYWWYPKNFLAPDRRVFGFAKRTMYYINPTGTGTISILAQQLPSAGAYGATASAVMYAPGKILHVGGGGDIAGTSNPARSAADVIDINGATPTVTTARAMPVALHWHTATVLADGRVAVTGGSTVANKRTGVNDRALLWTPSAGANAPGSWIQGARTTSNRARLYHSTAMLLPDGSVLVGGGGAFGPQTNTNAEIYYPPYLFNASGARATQPAIVSAPSTLPVGGSFNIGVNTTAIGRVTLVRTGSVTHSFNNEQRFMELPFTRSGTTLTVTAPASRVIAPPGYFLLFVLNTAGVPSLARIVAI